MSSSNQANYLGSRSIRCLTDTSNSVKLSKQLLSFLYSNLLLTKIVSFELSRSKIEYLCRFLAIKIPKCKRSLLRSQCNVMKWDFFNNFQTLWSQFLACRLLLRKSTLKTINYLDEKSALQKNLGKNLQKKKKIKAQHKNKLKINSECFTAFPYLLVASFFCILHRGDSSSAKCLKIWHVEHRIKFRLAVFSLQKCGTSLTRILNCNSIRRPRAFIILVKNASKCSTTENEGLENHWVRFRAIASAQREPGGAKLKVCRLRTFLIKASYGLTRNSRYTDTKVHLEKSWPKTTKRRKIHNVWKSSKNVSFEFARVLLWT